MWVTENSVNHVDRSEKSIILIAAPPTRTWTTDFSIAHMLTLLHIIQLTSNQLLQLFNGI
jgi:hypothetical protein